MSTAATVLVAPSDFRAGPWACRSLTAAGYRVVGAHQEGRFAGGRSLACRSPRRYPSPLDDPDGFVEALHGIVARDGVVALLPTSEDVVRVLASHGPELGAVVVGPSHEQYQRLCDKGALAIAAAEAGVDHPGTVVVGADGPEGTLPPLPCVVKPRISGEEMHGTAVAVTVRTEAERDAAVAALLEEGRDALVQALLDGPRWFAHSVGLGRDFRFLAFEAFDDNPRGSGPASFLRTARAPEGVREATLRLMELIDYAGPCSLSFIESDGRPQVHDVNLRLGATVGASIRSGFDIPRLAVDIALGRSIPAENGDARTITYVRMDGELGAMVDEFRGRGTGEGRGPLAARLAKGIAAPGWMIDPSPFDPFLVSTLAGRSLLNAARAARRTARGR
jgi:carbamoyl-phosphate synthase large subunit